MALLAALVLVVAAWKVADFILGELFLVFEHRHRVVVGGVITQIGFFFGEAFRQVVLAAFGGGLGFLIVVGDDGVGFGLGVDF